jgi:pimeloyl-ACP methyl ester carboxylesterase
MKISQNYFPNLILKIVPDSGHWVHAENPDIFLEETLAFLKS